MRAFLFVILTVTTAWGAFTTLYGTIHVLGQKPIQIIAAILFTLLVMGFLLSTPRIYSAPLWSSAISGILFLL